MSDQTNPDLRPIGPWKPTNLDGELAFVRDAPGPLGDDWAPVRVLRPKRTGAFGTVPRRVCLLGESAAAGFFYAPHATPARALEAHLGAAAGEGQFEVIDLTRVSLEVEGGPESLTRIVLASLQLEPDLLVVFAGNNWFSRAVPRLEAGEAALRQAGQRYASEGPAGLLAECRGEQRAF